MAKDDQFKRAEADLRIAQLKFGQALKNTDAPCTDFCNSLSVVLDQNTPANVQTCSEWIVKHIVRQPLRTGVLGDYLVAVAKAVVVDPSVGSRKGKAVRNRLDLLLVLGDVLHTCKCHIDHSMFPEMLKPYLEELVELAALAVRDKDSDEEKKLKTVINLWVANAYITREEFEAYRERAIDGLLVAQGGRKRRTYALPEWFGDRKAPWNELPASYMLKPMIENPNDPIDKSLISVKRQASKQASEHVRHLLEEYFDNIDLKYRPTGDNPTGETDKYKLWLDELGQLNKRNKKTGEVRVVSNGFGWSLQFCQDMQKTGLPWSIRDQRKAYEEERERRRGPMPRPSLNRKHSPDYRRDGRSNSQSRSRSYSPDSRGNGDGYRDRQRRSSRDDGRNNQDRRSRLDDHNDTDRRRPPPNTRKSRWNDGGSGNQQPSGGGYGGPATNYGNDRPGGGPPQGSQPSGAGYGGPVTNHGNDYPGGDPSQGSQPPTFPQSFPLHPTLNQLPGYANASFPPPPPPYEASGVPAPPPPPPSNYNNPYAGAPSNMGGYQNNAFSYGNNNYGYGTQGGYGGQAQGGFQSGTQGGYGGQAQGGFGGGYQGRGGYNQRGSYQGSKRGRGSRWN